MKIILISISFFFLIHGMLNAQTHKSSPRHKYKAEVLDSMSADELIALYETAGHLWIKGRVLLRTGFISAGGSMAFAAITLNEYWIAALIASSAATLISIPIILVAGERVLRVSDRLVPLRSDQDSTQSYEGESVR